MTKKNKSIVYKSITTYNSNKKTITFTEFTKEEYIIFLKKQIKVPGEYNLNSDTDFFYNQQTEFIKNKSYCNYDEDNKKYGEYWDNEKYKILNGLIIIDSNSNEYYITGNHYFYLNFLQIPNKVENNFTPPKFWDTDMWYFQNIDLAYELGLDIVGVKKRQCGISLKNASICIKNCYFSNGTINKILAWDKTYVENTWSQILDEYKNFLNENTAWIRNFLPDKPLDWKQQIESVDNGKKVYIGNKSIIKGSSFKNNPSKSVGGGVTLAVIEEPGIAPNLDKLLGFLKPATKAGHKKTGMTIIMGSVGNLKDCEPLKKLVTKPNNLEYLTFNSDESLSSNNQHGLFIPVYYSLEYYKDAEGNIKPGIDKHGNSLIEESKFGETLYRENLKKENLEEYNKYITQNPFTLEEAFGNTENNIFSTHIVKPHYDYLTISNIGYPIKLIKNNKNDNSIKYELDYFNKKITDYPVKLNSDKSGQIIFYEYPTKEKPPLGLYVAGIDPVQMLKTITSESLMTCYIWKCSHEINGEFTEDKLVAEYCGRHDDINITYNLINNLCELYNAKQLIENNVDSYINWLTINKKTQNIIKRTELKNLNEINPYSKVNSNYGVRINTKEKEYLFNLIEEKITEIKDAGFNEETGYNTYVYGVRQISDYMVLKEILMFKEKNNTDRIIALGLALWAAKVQEVQHLTVKSEQINKDKFMIYKTPSRFIKPKLFIKNNFKNIKKW